MFFFKNQNRRPIEHLCKFPGFTCNCQMSIHRAKAQTHAYPIPGQNLYAASDAQKVQLISFTTNSGFLRPLPYKLPPIIFSAVNKIFLIELTTLSIFIFNNKNTTDSLIKALLIMADISNAFLNKINFLKSVSLSELCQFFHSLPPGEERHCSCWLGAVRFLMSRNICEVIKKQAFKLVRTNISIMIIVIIINPYHYLHITFKIKSRIILKVETPGDNWQSLTVNLSSYLLLNNLNLIISS